MRYKQACGIWGHRSRRIKGTELYRQEKNPFMYDGAEKSDFSLNQARGAGVLPYMGYIGMYRCEGYGFQAVYSRIGYINQNIWV